MNLKYQIYAGAGVTRFESDESQRLLTSSPTLPPPVTRRPSPVTSHAFTLVEILVVVVLLSFIVAALMAVFSSTQNAFRASVTQTDVLEGGRNAMGLIRSDFESLTPSYGESNVTVNFTVNTNFWQYGSNTPPLVQALTGSDKGYERTNVLQYFYLLTRQNTTWTGVGYVVDTASADYLNPLYRFSISTNVQAASPAMLYSNFLENIAYPISPTNANLSHLLDGVVQLTVRAYGTNGAWLTGNTNFVQINNVQFLPFTLGEAGFFMYSNALPASVQVELGVLEDRTIQRAGSLADFAPGWARSNYLAQQSGKVHLFRQTIPIRMVDPAAYR